VVVPVGQSAISIRGSVLLILLLNVRVDGHLVTLIDALGDGSVGDVFVTPGAHEITISNAADTAVLYDTVVNCPECNAVVATSTPTATPLEGGVEAETSVPTAPRTDVLDSSGTSTPGTNFGLVLVIIGLLAFAVLFVTPMPASTKNRIRRR
jgi:hypothetical protein